MCLSPALGAALRTLHLATASTDLTHLLGLAVDAVPTCLGLSLTVYRGAVPISMTLLVPGSSRSPVRASLRIELPRPRRQAEPEPAVGGGAALVVYAGASGALERLGQDVGALLEMDPRRVAVDEHLALPSTSGGDDPARGFRDASDVDRALGVLLDRGYLTSDGTAELRRRADMGGTDVPTAARQLLADVAPTDGAGV